MDPVAKPHAQFNQLINDSVEKLVRNFAHLNESVAEQFAATFSLSQSPKPTIETAQARCLALIEAKDLAELDLIIQSIKKQFPTVNVHVGSNKEAPIECSPIKQEANEVLSSTPATHSSHRNYLNVSSSSSESAKSNSYSGFRNQLTTNGPMLNGARVANAGDRASSIDNSSLSSSNASFERQESKDSGFWNLNKYSFESMKSLSISDSNPHNSLHVQLTAQKQQQHAYATIKQVAVNGGKTSLSPHKSETVEPRKFLLTSPTNKSSVYNWKKGQAWRYSSSNLSENSNMANTNENSNTSFNANSNNSSFSNERAEDEPSNAPPPPHSFGFSNSFEYEPVKARSDCLPHWSSTSHLEVTDSNCLSLPSAASSVKGHKRRGKLMRERTIDNADELSLANCFGSSCSNEAAVNKKEGSPGRQSNTACGSSSTSSAAANNGRVSPPEKRLTLGTEFNTQELGLIMTHLTNNKNFLNEELARQILVDKLRQQQVPPVCTSPRSVVSSPSSISSCSSSLINTVKQLSLLSPQNDSGGPVKPDRSHSTSRYDNSSLVKQYEFYQGLHSKLNAKNDENEHLLAHQQQQQQQPQMLFENRLSPNNKYYGLIKNLSATGSMESAEQRYMLGNHLKNPIYRSNSSPSYSSLPSLAACDQQQQHNNSRTPPPSQPHFGAHNLSDKLISLNQMLKKDAAYSPTTAKQGLGKPLPEIVITESDHVMNRNHKKFE